jgi:hypothetical protein
MTGELSPAERFGRLESDRDDHEDRLRKLELWQTEIKTVLTLLHGWPSISSGTTSRRWPSPSGHCEPVQECRPPALPS